MRDGKLLQTAKGTSAWGKCVNMPTERTGT